MEKWKKIKGYEHYEVSTHGRIRNKHGLIMKQYYKERGDATIGLTKDNKRTTHRVARIVAQTFLEPDNNRHYVNHIDGNPRNNHISNLEWVTHSENINHAYKLGLMQNNKPVTLYCLVTKTSKEFHSQRSASRYLKRSKNFVQDRIARNDLNIEGRYLIIP